MNKVYSLSFPLTISLASAMVILMLQGIGIIKPETMLGLWILVSIIGIIIRISIPNSFFKEFEEYRQYKELMEASKL